MNKPSQNQIISWLKMYYELDVATLIPVLGGADHNAFVYRATTPAFISYFVKLIRTKTDNPQFIAEEFLSESGIQNIIAPSKNVHNKRLVQNNDFTIIVYPFVEGTNAFTTTLTPEQWVKLGKTLSDIHDIRVPEDIKSRIRREAFSSKWRNAVRTVIKHAHANKDYDSLGRKLISYLEEHIQIIHRLLDAAENLAPRLPIDSNTFVLCHADLHGGNILIDRAHHFFIIDWDGALMAPRERDLMFIGGGVGNVWNKPQETTDFYKGYGELDIDYELLAYYRIERILEDIAIYCELVMDSNLSHEDRLTAFDLFKTQFHSQGVIDIALSTYDNLN